MPKKSYKIKSRFEDVEEACKKLDSFCKECYLDNFSSELQLVLTEALNNIIEHAYNKEKNNNIDIQLEYNNVEFIIILSDHGVENNADFTKELNFDPDDIDSLPERGMGLFIINKIMSNVEYRRANNKNTFTLIKHLR
jgi:serine/threonine-protein kinase RsbW